MEPLECMVAKHIQKYFWKARNYENVVENTDEEIKAMFNYNKIITIKMHNGTEASSHTPNLRALLDSINKPVRGKVYIEVKRCILVVTNTFLHESRMLAQIQSSINSKDYSFVIELVDIRTVSCNVPDHIFAPESSIVPDEEINEIENGLCHVKMAMLPTISANQDAISIWNGYSDGQIIKINMPSFTAGETVYLRRVVNTKIK